MNTASAVLDGAPAPGLPTQDRPAQRGEGPGPARPDPSTGPTGPAPNQRRMPVKEVNSI